MTDKDHYLKFKKELILTNYRMNFDSFSEHLKQISTHRRLVITLNVPIVGFALNLRTTKIIIPALIVVIAIIFIFAFLELVMRAWMAVIREINLDIENLVKKNNLDNDNPVEKYSLRSTNDSVIRPSRETKIDEFFKSFKSFDFMMWHISMVLLFFLVLDLVVLYFYIVPQNCQPSSICFLDHKNKKATYKSIRGFFYPPPLLTIDVPPSG